MKITLVHEGITVSIEDPDVVTAQAAVALMRMALLAIGYDPQTVKDVLGED